MKRLTLALASAAAALSIATVAACGNAAPPAPTGGNPFTASPAAGHRAVASGPAASGTSAGGTSAAGTASGPGALAPSPAAAACKQQYDFWQQGPGQGLVTTVTAFGQPAVTGDPGALTAALAKAKPVLARASRNPMPVCADPRGYWTVLLMHVTAAAASAGSASSVTAAMKGVPAAARALLAELQHTAA